jgi:uncharacterized protein YjbI with pentapeptide repeats
VESFFHREPRTIPRVEIREFEPAEGEPSDGDADADVAAVPTEDAFVPSRPEDDRRWPTVRRLLLMLEAFPALAFAAAAAWNRRSDFLWVALAAGALPLLYSLAGAFRARGARSRRVVAALVMAVALGGSSFLVFRDCANRLKPAGNLSGCDLSDTSLAGLDLQGANLTGADLSGADLSRAVLGGADLTDADLRGADLSGADLSDAKLSGADLRGARLQEAGLERVTLTDANLAELDLSGLVLAGLDLSRARLSGADLTETDLTGAILDAALLDGAQLVRTSLAHASLRGASLFGATVLESDLSNARLNGVTLQEADIRVVSLVGATGFAMAELAAALGVPPREIGRGLSTHLVRLQLRAEVLGALGGACRGAPVEHAVQDSGDFHPLAIASAGGGASPMSRQALLHGWEPMATRFGDLVACLSPEVAETVEVCPGTAGAAGPPGRIQFTRQVRVVRVRTGAVVLDRVYRGSDPKPCPAAAEDNVRGSHVSFHALQADFTHLVMP